MAFHNVPPNGFPDIPDIEDLEAVEKDISGLKTSIIDVNSNLTDLEDWTDADAKTVTGNPITITDAAALPAKSLVMTIEPIQSGSGTPSPDNVRPISGLTSGTVQTTDGTDTNTATITFGTTVYGGSVNFNTGVCRVTYGIANLGDIVWTYQETNDTFRATAGAFENAGYPIKKNGIVDIKCSIYPEQQGELTDKYIDQSNASSNIFIKDTDYGTDASAFKTAMDGVQLCYELATPTELTLTPAELELLKGNNTVTANGATISLTYQPDNLKGDIMTDVDAEVDGAKAYTDAKVAAVLPTYPTTDGAYVLTATVSSGETVLSWESTT